MTSSRRNWSICCRHQFYLAICCYGLEGWVGSGQQGVGSGSPYGPANPIAQQPGRQPQLPPTASQVSCQWLRPGNGVNPTCQLSLAISVSRLPRGNSPLLRPILLLGILSLKECCSQPVLLMCQAIVIGAITKF